MEMQIFQFELASEIRGCVIDGEPAVCAKDVAVALGYSNPSKAINDHCKGVTIRYPLQTEGGMQEARFIREADLYRLIMRANTSAAERFQDWVCEEVLPTIRATGGFGATMPQSYSQALIALAASVEKEEQAERRLIAVAPKVAYANKLADSAGVMTTTAVAKRMRMSAKCLHKMLHEHGVLFRTDGGWVPYSKYQHLEGTYFKFVVSEYYGSGDSVQRRSQSLKWLEAGAQWVMAEVERWRVRQVQEA